MNKKGCIVITGTIIPNSNFVVVSNPEVRLKEYSASLLFYAQKCNMPIFFAENSGYDIHRDAGFSKLLKENGIVLMKFPLSTEYEKGKGYQEFEMLDKVVDHLEREYDFFIKITGRQCIQNIKKICDLQFNQLVIDRYRDLKVALSNVFCCDVSFYQKVLKGIFALADDSKGLFIEHVIYLQLEKYNKYVSLFPFSPQIKGVSGSFGRDLQGNRTKFKLRNAERKILMTAGIRQFPKKY